MDSIVKTVYIFILYTFIVTATYFLLSMPVEAIFSGFEGADFAGAETYKNTLMPTIRTAFTLAMAIMISIPVTWFVMKIFSREPAYYTYRRD